MRFKRLISFIMVLAVTIGCIDLHMWQAQSYQEQNDPFIQMQKKIGRSIRNEQYKNDGNTSRYIVKYKDGRDTKFKRKLGDQIKESIPVNKKTDKTSCELIKLKKEIDPSKLADDLRKQKAERDIEWIMPDYPLNLSQVTANENSDDSTLPKSNETNEPQTETSKKQDEDSKTSSDPVTTNDEDTTTPPDLSSENDNDTKTSTDTSTENSDDQNNENKDDNKDTPENKNETDSSEKENTNGEATNTETVDAKEEVSTSVREIIVAVIDSGVDITHPLIRDKLWVNTEETLNENDDDQNGYTDDINGCNVLDKTGHVFNEQKAKESNHGTHVAGIIAKMAAEQKVPVKIMPIRAFENGIGYTSDIIAAIEYANSKGASVINLSFGGTEQNPALEEAMANSNALFVCAAGNARQNIDEKPVYPACSELEQVINVTSVNADDGFSYFSNYGVQSVDVAALGRDVESALSGGVVGNMTGTSVSAAYVSACAAVALSRNLAATPLEAKQKLLETSDRLSNLQDKVCAGRRINLDNLLSSTVVTEITQVNPAGDFDVTSYTPLSESEAFEVFSKKKVREVKLGQNHCIALLEDGTVWAWGNNDYGQLGNNTRTSSYYPVRVLGLKNIVKIAAGGSHNLAIDSENHIWTWGKNASGQLGQYDSTDRLIPYIAEKASSGWTYEQIAAGNDFSMLLMRKFDGLSKLYVCGSNQYGQLGNPNLGNSFPYFTENNAPTFALKIAAGGEHAFILVSDGAYGWGRNNYGQLGNGQNSNITTPTKLHPNAKNIACADQHSFIINKDGTGMGFGSNSCGCLTDLIPPGSTEPINEYNYPVYSFGDGSDDPIQNVVGGSGHSVILYRSGKVAIWGSNYSGQLGMTTQGDYNDRVCQNYILPAFNDVVQIDAKGNNTAFVRRDGSLWIAGDGFYGQRGDKSPYKAKPTLMKDISGVTDIKVAARSAVALMQGGTVKTWGDNTNNALGIPGAKSSYIPKQIEELQDIGWIDASGIAVSSRIYNYFNTQGKCVDVYEWGATKEAPVKKEVYQAVIKYSKAQHELMLLQNGTIYDNTACTHTYCNGLDTQITDVSDVVSSSNGQAIALKKDGTVWTWGCYPGTTASGSAHTPHQITQLSGIKSIAMRGNEAWALKNDGTIWTWNYYMSTVMTHSIPVQKYGQINVSKIALGSIHLLILNTNGQVYAVGNNSKGQLGDGTTTNRDTPVLVSDLHDVTNIFAGSDLSFAVCQDGSVYSWGNNSDGRLGIGEGLPKYEPNQIGALNSEADDPNLPIKLGTINDGQIREGRFDTQGKTDYYQFSVPNTGVYAISTTGVSIVGEIKNGSDQILAHVEKMNPERLICKLESGTQYYLNLTANQSGNYEITFYNPTRISNIVAVSGGANHSMALEGNGTIWTWGDNAFGQLGDGTQTVNKSPKQIRNFSNNIAIASGNSFSMALKDDGTVWTWGRNNRGQLGGAGGSQALVPVKINTLSNVMSIAAGEEFALALRKDGTVWAWGYNNYGQLGNGNNTQETLPVEVNGLTDIVAIAAGNSHALALRADGTVHAWGYNANGQLGDGTTNSKNTPVVVTNMQNVKKISTGSNHSMAILGDGSVYLWGKNSNSQLGTITGDTTKPQKLNDIQGAYRADGGMEHTAILMRESNACPIKTMGSNSSGQLGRTTSDLVNSSTGGAFRYTDLDAGRNHNIALDSKDSVWAWGENTCGQIGNGSTSNVLLPVNITNTFSHDKFYNATLIQVGQPTKALLGTQDSAYYMEFRVEQTGDYTISLSHGVGKLYDEAQIMMGDQFSGQTTRTLSIGTYYLRVSDMQGVSEVNINLKSGANSGMRSVSAGNDFSLVVDAKGQAWGFGKNNYGQIGDGTTSNKTIPVQIADGIEMKMAVSGGDFGLLLAQNGQVYSFGNDNYYQLGMRISSENTPQYLMDVQNARAIAAGYHTSYVLKEDGTVWAWGDNTTGQLGNGTNTSSRSAVQVQGLSGIIQIAAGDNFALALGANGKVYAWGQNTSGQLGRGNTTNSNSPAIVNISGSVSYIAAGSSHAIAVVDNGNVYSWGNNSSGQLGLGDTTNQSTPAIINGIVDAKILSAGEKYSFVAMKDGSVVTFGTNENGTLGINAGEGAKYTTPQFMNNFSDIIMIDCGNRHTIAVSKTGKIYTWGINYEGALGNAAVEQMGSPAIVNGISDVIDVAVGGYHSLAVKTDGTVWAWGFGLDGQLGNGTLVFETEVPTQVAGLTNVKAVAAGQYHSLALKNDGTIWAWGSNGYGQLGTGSSNYTPVQVPGLSGITEIASGGNFSMARKSDGTLYTWGANESGQLGIGSIENKSTPQLVPGLSSVAYMAAGYAHCIVYNSSNNGIYTWGNNVKGQLGNGTQQNKTTPSLIRTEGCYGVAAGREHSLMIGDYDFLYVCGSNEQGQLGSISSGIHTNMELINADIGYIDAGENISVIRSLGGDPIMYGDAGRFALPVITKYALGSHSLAIDNNKKVWSWGKNSELQLGRKRVNWEDIPCNITAMFTVNDSFDTAINIGTRFHYIGALNQKEKSHYIKFKIDMPGNYTLRITGNQLTTKLYGASRQLAESSFDHVADDLQTYAFSSTGEYYLEVIGVNTGTYDFRLIPNNATSDQSKLALHKNITYDFAFKANNVSSFQNLTYTLTYPVGDFEVVTLCAESPIAVTGVGKVPNTDVNITSVQDGKIQFKITKTPTSPFTGTVNTVKLRGLREGESKVQLKVE